MSNVLTLPSGETSLDNTISESEPNFSQLQLSGSQLQLNMDGGDNNIPNANDSNDFTVSQTDGPCNEREDVYGSNSSVDDMNESNEESNKNNEPDDVYQANFSVDHGNERNEDTDANKCAVDSNNYLQERKSNVPVQVFEKEQIIDTHNAWNAKCILPVDDNGSDVESQYVFEIEHEDPEDEEIKLLVFQEGVDKYFLASVLHS